MVCIGANCAISGNMKPIDKMMARIDPDAPTAAGVMRDDFAKAEQMLERFNALAR